MQCGAVIIPFLQNITKDSHSSPWGCLLCSKYDICVSLNSAVMYSFLCRIGPLYNGICVNVTIKCFSICLFNYKCTCFIIKNNHLLCWSSTVGNGSVLGMQMAECVSIMESGSPNTNQLHITLGYYYHILSLQMEKPTSLLSLRWKTMIHTYSYTPPESVLCPLHPRGQMKFLTRRSFPAHDILGGSFRSEQHLTQSLSLQPHGIDTPFWDPGNRSEHIRVHVA